MRAIAAILALVYAALAVAGPAAHAAEARQRLVPALEDQHGPGCRMGHDPATCPLALLGRAALAAAPSAHTLVLPQAHLAPSRSSDRHATTRSTSGPGRARAPPILLVLVG